ncbi:MAG: hydrogenase maturation nickel metallochaperone HypA [Bryobacteraceae bacterium]|nr:hydrogenase maturation nickel metallochaperone HypA [Bryobacterales bacterium]MEB2362989.1 hydrogenase maturation nickel metallochaperone HypA [Bryobacterales bacterium]NUN03394.1 hydrogenase maturation nickel metallochaperone HypA [Bryobacteraceae bacterium]
MHESSLISSLIDKVVALAEENNASTVKAVEISIGALAGVSPEYLMEQFRAVAAGTIAGEAELRIEVSKDKDSPRAHELVLITLELER